MIRALPEAIMTIMRYAMRSAALLIALCAVLNIQAGERKHAKAVRVLSVTASGPVVTLQLADGRTVQAAESSVRIRNASDRDKEDRAGARQSVDQLRQMTSGARGMTAVARVAYRADGTVKKVKITTFASEAETVAFLNRKPVESKPAQ
jgi:hypothetical protein